MVVRLERMNKIDSVLVIAEKDVASQFLGLLIDGKVGLDVLGGRLLGKALDGNVLASEEIVRQEDHAKGAMVQRRDGLEAAVKNQAIVEVVS